MMRSVAQFTRVVLALLLCTALLATAGCGGDVTIEYDPDGGDYDETSLAALMDETDMGDVAEIATADAPDARNEALIDLRTHGDDASSLADVLTRDFPLNTEAVPVLVEIGTFDGEDAWIIVEAWGSEGGTLEHRRVWVFSSDGSDLLYSASRR